VYRELSQLEDLGWVSFRQVGTDDRAARAYRLTDEGRDQLPAWASSARFDPPTLRFPVARKVWAT
jgi:DNA-binding PadR family transcriptional regulator